MSIMRADQCRKLAETPYIKVFTEIEERAKRGNLFYQERYRSPENIPEDLKKILLDLGFIIEIDEIGDWDEDHHGNIEEETYRKLYTVKIKW